MFLIYFYVSKVMLHTLLNEQPLPHRPCKQKLHGHDLCRLELVQVQCPMSKYSHYKGQSLQSHVYKSQEGLKEVLLLFLLLLRFNLEYLMFYCCYIETGMLLFFLKMRLYLLYLHLPTSEVYVYHIKQLKKKKKKIQLNTSVTCCISTTFRPHASRQRTVELGFCSYF